MESAAVPGIIFDTRYIKPIGWCSMDETLEKRQYVRYPLNGGAEVVLHVSRFFNLGREKQIKLGAVVDISVGGMAVRYALDDVAAIKARNLSIVIPGRGTQVSQIPFEIVTDCHLFDCPDTHPIRKCGLKFGTLNDDQFHRIRYLIENFGLKLK